MHRRLTRSLVSVVVAAALTSGCAAAEEPARVKERGEARVSDGEPQQTEEAEGPGTAKVGDTVEVGDWDVRVTKVVQDAGTIIEQANEFNDPAKRQYLLLTYAATYQGSERTADAWVDLTWTYTTATNKVRSEASVVTPADSNLNSTTTARSGGTVTGQVAFDVSPEDIKQGILTVEGYDADFSTIYADFTL